MSEVAIEPDGKPATAIAIIAPSSLPTILAADEGDILGKLKAELAGYVPDATTPRGRDEIGSKAKKVGTAKQDLLRIAKTLKEDAQKTLRAINAEEHVVEERCDAIRDQILAPRKAYEQIERDRVAAHQEALAALLALGDVPEGDAPYQIAVRVENLDAAAKRDWQEYGTRAAEAVRQTRFRLDSLYAAAVKREADAAELERLRAEQAERDRLAAVLEQQRREERIAAEAAAKAKADAEAKAEAVRLEVERRAQMEREAAAKREREAQEATQRAQEAAERAEREKGAAIAKAEQDRLDAERRAQAAAKEAEARAERGRIAAVEAERKRTADAKAAEEAEEARRAADKAHRGEVNREALTDLVAAGLSDAHGRAAIAAIVKGAVRHITMRY